MKRKIQQSARKAGLDMSEWILNGLFPERTLEFNQLIETLVHGSNKKVAYAAIADFLTGLSPLEFKQAVSPMPPLAALSDVEQNYLAAMLEFAAHQQGVAPPAWVRDIDPLAHPYYGAPFKSLRLHLLMSSPIPFKRRNIFIDSSLGDRV